MRLLWHENGCLILIRGIWDNLEPTLRQLTE